MPSLVVYRCEVQSSKFKAVYNVATIQQRASTAAVVATVCSRFTH